jgi:predicted nucleic acid-binding protein
MSADAVKPEAREAWMAARVAEGIAVVLVNPHLVRVGLDLVDFPSIVCFGIDHQMRRLSQSIRRAWRITQEKDCRVVFARYNTTPLNAATALTAAKLQAAARFAGRSADGLAASATEDADDLLGALLRHLDRGTAADLRGGFTAYPLTTEASVPRAPVAAIVPVAVAPIGPRPPEDPAGPDRQMALFMA